ncbi:MAG: hypothetical protein AB7V62_04985 [Thermoleophilia bacterium]
MAPAGTLLAPPPLAPPSPPRRRSRAKPKPPRSRLVVMSELRGCAGMVLELALLDGTAAPQASILTWANRLAAEMDLEGVGSPANYRDLLHGIVTLSRRALADPDRPMVALPPAA